MRGRKSCMPTCFPAWALLSLCALAGPAAAQDPPSFVPDEFVVLLTPEARGDFTVAAGPTVNLASLQNIITAQNVIAFSRQFPAAEPQPLGSPFHDMTGYYKVKIGAGGDLDTAIAAFAADPSVDDVGRIGITDVHGCAPAGTPITPDDTSYGAEQWNLWSTYGIDANLAWRIATGNEDVVLVAMDTGVRYAHEDLGGDNPPGPLDGDTDGNIWVNPFEIPNGIDDDGNHLIDDIVGWDFVHGATPCATGEDCNAEDNDPNDFLGHGTHVAGIMAAITNNNRGIAGVAGGFGDGRPWSGAKVMVLRMGWKTPTGPGQVRLDYAAEALNYVTDMKMRGVNMAAVNASWGSGSPDPASPDYPLQSFRDAVDNLLAADVMLIHSAGNESCGDEDPVCRDYLGNKDGVMNVGATHSGGGRWTAGSFGSNHGSWVDIAAPGSNVFSTWYDGSADTYGPLSGTSMAAPHVAGVAALLEFVGAREVRADGEQRLPGEQLR